MGQCTSLPTQKEISDTESKQNAKPPKFTFVHSKHYKRYFNRNYKVSVCAAKGARKTMEDHYLCQFTFADHEHYSLFGIFDGHNGSEASRYVADHLYNALNDLTDLADSEAIVTAVEQMEKEFLLNTTYNAGCALVFALTHHETGMVDEIHDIFSPKACSAEPNPFNYAALASSSELRLPPSDPAASSSELGHPEPTDSLSELRGFDPAASSSELGASSSELRRGLFPRFGSSYVALASTSELRGLDFSDTSSNDLRRLDPRRGVGSSLVRRFGSSYVALESSSELRRPDPAASSRNLRWRPDPSASVSELRRQDFSASSSELRRAATGVRRSLRRGFGSGYVAMASSSELQRPERAAASSNDLWAGIDPSASASELRRARGRSLLPGFETKHKGRVFWCGHARAFSVRSADDESVDTFSVLTTDHNTENLDECERVVKAGGTIINDRVDGKLGVTRAFGGRPMKYEGSPVVCKCEYRAFNADIGDALLLSCDGLTEKWSDATLMRKLEFNLKQDGNKKNGWIDTANAMGGLVDDAIAEGSDDNVSVMFIQFKDGRKRETNQKYENV